MDIETIVISGIAAFLGALAAMTFQYWREYSAKLARKENVLQQAISLLQHQRLIIETFYENAIEHENKGLFHVPNVPPPASISKEISTEIAGYIPHKYYELFILAVTTYSSFTNQANSLRERHFSLESSVNGEVAISPSQYAKLGEWFAAYKQVLVTANNAHGKIQEILVMHLNNVQHHVYGRVSGFSFYSAALSAYILISSVAAVVFFILWKINV